MEISIKYCTVWNHLSRVVTLVESVLNKHKTTISNLNIIPSTGGVFDIFINNKLVFSKDIEKRFPEEQEIEKIIKNLL